MLLLHSLPWFHQHRVLTLSIINGPMISLPRRFLGAAPRSLITPSSLRYRRGSMFHSAVESIWLQQVFRFSTITFLTGLALQLLNAGLSSEDGAPAVLACMATRQVVNVQFIIDHLDMKVNTSDVHASQTADIAMELFKSRLSRYLQGQGHPPEHRGSMISEDAWYKHERNPFLRCQLLLLATTESDLIPVLPTWSIQVSVIHTLLTFFTAHTAFSSATQLPQTLLSTRFASSTYVCLTLLTSQITHSLLAYIRAQAKSTYL